MKTVLHFTNQYTSPEVDACIKNLEHELIDFANVQAQSDAKKNQDLSQPYFKIQVSDFVHGKVQKAIDFIKRTLLAVAEIFNAKELEQVAQKKAEEIDIQINEKKHTLATFTRKRNLITLDPLKKKYGKIFLVAAVILGVGDAILAFVNFIATGAYPIVLALFAAASIGIVVGLSHLAYAGWIRQAQNKIERAIKISGVLFVAFVLFAVMGNLRAAASNATVDIALTSHEVSAITPGHLNGWAICLVSFLLFIGIFSMSLLLWKSKKERLDEEVYDNLTRDIGAIKSQIEALSDEKEMLISTVVAQKNEARKKYDLLKTAIPQCKSIGINAINLYKQTYIRSNHIVPTFFNDPINFQYDETIQFSQSHQTDHV